MFYLVGSNNCSSSDGAYTSLTIRFEYIRQRFESKGEVLRMLCGVGVHGQLKSPSHNAIQHCSRAHLPWGYP